MIFEKSPLISSVVIVGASGYLKEFPRLVRRYRLKKISRIVAGGATRLLSVFHGLQALDADTQYVLIHDAARPLVSLKIVEEAVKCCYKEDSVIVAVPAKPTIKQVNANTLTDARKKTGGKYQGTSRMVVSNGGKTMTTTTKGINADGKEFTSVFVFDKQ